jgi:AraC family transcriptional regulator, regulatory protein of adaptative response / methylated-DNA-[protein]-cysteine methyltransferase
MRSQHSDSRRLPAPYLASYTTLETDRMTLATATSMATNRLDPADAWAAVVGRDRRFDGHFVYAVRTTGVYCRPSCPSRRPLAVNVRFFQHAAAAERAGFRACKRCQPRAAAAPSGAAAVRAAAAFIDAHAEERITLTTLAREVGMSPFHLQRIFRRELGVTPREYQQGRRLDRLRSQLRKGVTVSRATYDAGFGSPSRVYEQSAQLGMTPAVYRRGGEGLSVRFATVESQLGQLLVAATARGVCMVSLGDSTTELERRLRTEFPRATVKRDDGALAEQVRRIIAHIRGDGPAHDLPLDVRGTAFQQRVWRALLAIPYGETRSYAEVAAAIGQPAATRAVARACATNPIAVVIPCHRVIRSDGTLGGYAGGVERKERLLNVETSGRRARVGSGAARDVERNGAG